MKVLWTRRATRDLIEIARFIARDNPDSARGWAAKLKKRAHDVTRAPLAGRVVPEMGDEHIREVLLRNYRMVYQVNEKNIVVLTIFESHRLLPIKKAK